MQTPPWRSVDYSDASERALKQTKKRARVEETPPDVPQKIARSDSVATAAEAKFVVDPSTLARALAAVRPPPPASTHRSANIIWMYDMARMRVCDFEIAMLGFTLLERFMPLDPLCEESPPSTPPCKLSSDRLLRLRICALVVAAKLIDDYYFVVINNINAVMKDRSVNMQFKDCHNTEDEMVTVLGRAGALNHHTVISLVSLIAPHVDVCTEEVEYDCFRRLGLDATKVHLKLAEEYVRASKDKYEPGCKATLSKA